MDLCQYRLSQTSGPLLEYRWITALIVLGEAILCSTLKLNMP